MKRIICFGDSNTWGYDPRSFLAGRYPTDVIWPSILGKELNVEVINEGLNGRAIPEGYEIQEVIRNIRANMDEDTAICIMIGSNNILSGEGPQAGELFEKFVSGLLTEVNNTNIILIAPPLLKAGEWVVAPSQIKWSRAFGQEVVEIAQRYGTKAIDLTKEDIPVLFDGVHLSEEGHSKVAKIIISRLDNN